MFFVVMGVSGCGKSSVGLELASRLDWEFQDADAFHPESNVAKMRAGIPLTDADREGWMQALTELLHDRAQKKKSLVLACSALREAYRQKLRGNYDLYFVYLRGSRALIAERLGSRKGHFMNPALLESQFAILEEPTDALVVDVKLSIVEIVDRVLVQAEQRHLLSDDPRGKPGVQKV